MRTLSILHSLFALRSVGMGPSGVHGAFRIDLTFFMYQGVFVGLVCYMELIVSFSVFGNCLLQCIRFHFFQEEATLRKTNTELESKTNELERISRTAERVRKEVDDLIEERRTLVTGLTKLQDDRAVMEEGQRATDKRISQLRR